MYPRWPTSLASGLSEADLLIISCVDVHPAGCGGDIGVKAVETNHHLSIFVQRYMFLCDCVCKVLTPMCGFCVVCAATSAVHD